MTSGGIALMITVLALARVAVALATGRAAADRGRSQWGGIWFGLILGLLGLSIVMLMAPAPGIRR